MPVEFKDYYKTLGLSRTASNDEIRKAFRKLARQYHPDLAQDKKVAEEKFKEINEAYEVLGDPEKRKKYDTLGENWNQPGGFRPPPGWQRAGGTRTRAAAGENFEFHFGGTGFSDFFEQFFAGRGFESAFQESEPFASYGGAGRRPQFAQRGGDVEGDIMVTLGEALHGSVRSISLQRVNPLTGAQETQTFRVRVPAGVQEGGMIRVSGKGEPGIGDGKPGDLYLRVRFARHPEFEVRGSDLYHELELTPWEAVLGATVRVPTLEGAVSLRIPPGTTNRQQLRVRGKGLPTAGGGRGDLYAIITIELPSKVSDEEKRLWEELAKRSTFHPRSS